MYVGDVSEINMYIHAARDKNDLTLTNTYTVLTYVIKYVHF